MTHITTADGRTVSLDELERAAREATPGPVKVTGANDDSRWLLPDCFPYECWIAVAGRDCAANAAHIAAFDRDVCLALIAALRQADERVRQYEPRCAVCNHTINGLGVCMRPGGCGIRNRSNP